MLTFLPLDLRSTPCVFLGYPDNHHGYLYLVPSKSTLFISWHAIFHENIFPCSNINKYQETSYDFLNEVEPSPYITHPHLIPSNPPPSNSDSSHTLSPSFPNQNSPITSTVPSPPPPSHPMQTLLKSGITKPKTIFSLHTQNIFHVPPNPKVSLFDKYWIKAMTT